jgi:hypothetical protein
VLARNGAGLTHRFDDGEARKIVSTGKRDRRSSKPPKSETQEITAQLSGDDTCTAEGYTERGHAPILMMCRRLIASGVDPDRSLIAYRNTTACIIVNGIGKAARLEINTKGTAFCRHRAVRTAPPARQKQRRAS